MREKLFKSGDVALHKASEERVVLLVDQFEPQGYGILDRRLYACRHYNKKTGLYSKGEFFVFELEVEP